MQPSFDNILPKSRLKYIGTVIMTYFDRQNVYFFLHFVNLPAVRRGFFRALRMTLNNSLYLLIYDTVVSKTVFLLCHGCYDIPSDMCIHLSISLRSSHT